MFFACPFHILLYQTFPLDSCRMSDAKLFYNLLSVYPSFFILSNLQFGVEIANEGANDENNVEAVCVLDDNGTELYRDTSTVAQIVSQSSGIAMFKPIMFTEPAEFSLSVKLINIPSDYNDYNNAADLSLNVGTYIDGFESDYGFWEMEPGWLRNNIIDRHAGRGAAWFKIYRTVSKRSIP